MQIDVIIPTYNRGHLVSRAIESVLNQTYQNFILYIVDDGSSDETQNVLKIYKDHHNIRILHRENGGVSQARNYAVNNSTSDWISFLDSDDEWLPNKLQLQVAFLEAHPTIRFLHSEEIWVRNGIRVNPKMKHQKSNEDLFLRSLDFCLISPSTVIMKRDLFLECGGFDNNFVVCEDYDLWLKILLREKIGFISENTAIKNGGHNDQLSTKYVAMDYWRIKSLVSLYQNSQLRDSEKREQIKTVVLKKSEILLRGYLKHQNQEAFDEVTKMLTALI